jgi:membrane-associated phospholipid phosphatase
MSSDTAISSLGDLVFLLRSIQTMIAGAINKSFYATYLALWLGHWATVGSTGKLALARDSGAVLAICLGLKAVTCEKRPRCRGACGGGGEGDGESEECGGCEFDSFPSGHAMLSAALAWGGVLAAASTVPSMAAAAALMCAWAGTVAWARVVERHHHTIDVVVGAALGIAVPSVLNHWCSTSNYMNRKKCGFHTFCAQDPLRMFRRV